MIRRVSIHEELKTLKPVHVPNPPLLMISSENINAVLLRETEYRLSLLLSLMKAKKLSSVLSGRRSLRGSPEWEFEETLIHLLDTGVPITAFTSTLREIHSSGVLPSVDTSNTPPLGELNIRKLLLVTSNCFAGSLVQLLFHESTYTIVEAQEGIIGAILLGKYVSIMGTYEEAIPYSHKLSLEQCDGRFPLLLSRDEEMLQQNMTLIDMTELLNNYLVDLGNLSYVPSQTPIHSSSFRQWLSAAFSISVLLPKVYQKTLDRQSIQDLKCTQPLNHQEWFKSMNQYGSYNLEELGIMIATVDSTIKWLGIPRISRVGAAFDLLICPLLLGLEFHSYNSNGGHIHLMLSILIFAITVVRSASLHWELSEPSQNDGCLDIHIQVGNYWGLSSKQSQRVTAMSVIFLITLVMSSLITNGLHYLQILFLIQPWIQCGIAVLMRLLAKLF